MNESLTNSAFFELIKLSNQSGKGKEILDIASYKKKSIDFIDKAVRSQIDKPMKIFKEIDKDEERIVPTKRAVN